VIDESWSKPLDAAQAELVTRAVRAARELCELLWESLHQELRDPREGRVRELSQRLADVSSTVALLTATPLDGPGERRSRPESVGPAVPPSGVATAPPRPISPVPEPAPVSQPRRTEPPRAEPPPPEPAASAPRAAQDAPSPPGGEPLRVVGEEPVRMRLVDELEQAEQPVSMAMSAAVDGQATLGGVRPQQGPLAWVNTVGRLLERHAVDGLPFAVLLVEVVDVAQIERSESPMTVSNLIAQVEGALGKALRAHDTLTRESMGRYWLVAPETNGTGARMLGERLARLVRSSASHRGVPLEVAVGIAICPEDGIEAPELAARADLSVYSARATGKSVARAEPPA
jgi:GGDEF domain-containing protein